MASIRDLEIVSPNDVTPPTPDIYLKTENEEEADGYGEGRMAHGHTSKASDLSRSPVSQIRFQRTSSRSSSAEISVTPDTLSVEEIPRASERTFKKEVAPSAPTFLHLPDITEEALETFEVLEDCTYSNKYIGRVDDALDCDCKAEWDTASSSNKACGIDSDCINRATKMECTSDCRCGDCQNRRFQKRQYAEVAVVQTEKKGYGLRTNVSLHASDFVIEYIGEIVGENKRGTRMAQYDREKSITHFYFMGLTGEAFIDATKKGNLGRFCNHSCNPNCQVEKWVVGDQLRMGIFAKRPIAAGEELVFNYNVDRYGAKSQKCYCGESNCKGTIGGKTQTEGAPKLTAETIDALGMDEDDAFDMAMARKNRKKKAEEDDDEYIEGFKPRALDSNAVTQVMASLMQSKDERWIVVKLLGRLQRCDDERASFQIVRMHGYEILKSTLTKWVNDSNIVLQILDLLNKLPKIARNKIEKSQIEGPVEQLAESENEEVKNQASQLLQAWAQLTMEYRIPRRQRGEESFVSRRDFLRRSRSRSPVKARSPSPEPQKYLSAPTGPKAGVPLRNNFRGPPTQSFPPRPFSRPGGYQSWVPNYTSSQHSGGEASSLANGGTSGLPGTPKGRTDSRLSLDTRLQDIIDSCARENEQKPKLSTPEVATPQSKEYKDNSDTLKQSSRDPQKNFKIAIAPIIKEVVDKYYRRIGEDKNISEDQRKRQKEELKDCAKKASEKIVERDFKVGNRKDFKIDGKRAEKIKNFTKEYIKAKTEAQKKHQKKSKKQDANGEDVKKTADPRRPYEKGHNGVQKTGAKDDEVGQSEGNPDRPLNRKRRSPPSSRPSSSLDHVNGNASHEFKRVRSDTPSRDAAGEDEKDIPMDLSD